MIYSLRSILSNFYGRHIRIWRLILWVFGLSFGAYSAAYVAPYTYSGVRCGQAGVLALLFVRLLPVLVMLLTIYLSNEPLLMLLILIKAFFFAFACVSIALSLSASAGLIIFLMLFSEIFSLPGLWLVFISCDRRFPLIRSLLLGAIVLIVTVLDSVYIMPFLRRLLLF